MILTILPLLAAGWVIQAISAKNHSDRADQGLTSSLVTAGQIYSLTVHDAVQAATVLAYDPALQQSVPGGDHTAPKALLKAISKTVPGIQFAAYSGSGGLLAGTDGLNEAMAAPHESVAVDIGETGGRVVAYVPVTSIVDRLQPPAITGDRILVVTGGFAYRAGAPPVRIGAIAPGRATQLNVEGQRERALASRVANSRTTLVAIIPQHRLDSVIRDVRVRTAAVIAIAVLAIAILAGLLVRSLTATLRRFAEGARAVTHGRFDQRIAVRGRDEFAQFGRAFNEMSRELERRIGELEHERKRVQDFSERFGSALAATHDVAGLLEIVLDSAIQLARARGGRLLVTDEGSNDLVEQLRMGDIGDAEPLLDAPLRLGEGAEGKALQSLLPASIDSPAILCAPMVTEEKVLGLLTLVNPASGSFEADAHRTVGALAAQGAVAIENARLHRLIQKQAKTDGSTGLANHREFQEQLGHEVERAQRFGVPVGLVLLDLDDFKLINDRFGHLAGDSVLRSVAGTIKLCTRDIDHAARYGGEEFAVVLPHTTVEGAARLAERIRQAIAERPVTVPDGRQIRVTASFGAAAVPGDAITQVELIAAADAALYRAKQAGKNRIAVGRREPSAAT